MDDYKDGRIVLGKVIKKGATNRFKEIEDIHGKRYNRLVAIEYSGKKGRAQSWKFRCDCGNIINSIKYDVTSGHTKSCGCLNREQTAIRNKKTAKWGGVTNENWFNSYNMMVYRVTNNKYEHYQHYIDSINGKLIEQEWVDNPWEFFKEIGPKPDGDYSIDRIDSSRGYVKGNVRWATKRTQALNRKFVKHSASGLVGIHEGKYADGSNKYAVAIGVNCKQIYLGVYHSLREAKICRYRAEEKYGYPHTFSINQLNERA